VSKIESFEIAFRSHDSGCRRICQCGKEYWDCYNSGYSWEEGEREELAASDAIACEHSIECVVFEGGRYVQACDCWHPRARKIVDFLDANRQAIGEYFALEKKRIERIAQSFPIVESLAKAEQ
jgi:hypothetical protein